MAEEGDDVVCRGSWALGTACGGCSRCREEAPRAIAHLRDKVAVLTARMQSVIACIPAPLSLSVGYDLADKVKVHMFNAAREQLYADEDKFRG